MDYVQRFVKPLDYQLLEEVLTGTRRPVEPLPTPVPLDPVREAVGSLDPGYGQSELDQALLEPLHRSLPMSAREAADMRVWHWLCAVEFPELVWRRWRRGGVPAEGEAGQALTTALSRRFLGSSSLAGVSRNTLARLWWTADRLRDGDDYSLARQALENQDLFQNVFERFFGVYPPAAKACLDRFRGRGADDIRRASRWLQHVLSTTALEALTQDDIAAILDEGLSGD